MRVRVHAGVLAHQVSDVHLSEFDADRTRRFGAFLHALPAVQPSVVLETGDITDARQAFGFVRRGQNVKDWEVRACACVCGCACVHVRV